MTPPPPSSSASADTVLRCAQFARRHIGPSDADIETMMKTVGVSSLDNLVDRTVPHSIRLDEVSAHTPARTRVLSEMDDSTTKKR